MKPPRAQGRPNEFVPVLFSTKAHYCNKVNIFQPSDSSVLRCFVIYLGYNPHKGTKTSAVLNLPCTIMYNPRKGAKTILFQRLELNKQYNPRKGAKTCNRRWNLLCCKYNPRKGAKAFVDLARFFISLYNPRKGANQIKKSNFKFLA